MKIGFDISQIAYEKTGVANYLFNLIKHLLVIDKKNQYILFYSSLRRNLKSQISNLKSTSQNLKIKTFRFPPLLLDFLWNKLHILPIEWLIGDVDVFITSDWTEPPTLHAKKATILYDLIVCDKGIDEQTSGFNGFRSRISELRAYLNIKETVVTFTNQFKRKSHFKKHWLTETEKKKAIKLYKSLK